MIDTRQPIHRTFTSWAFTLLLGVFAVNMGVFAYENNSPKAQAASSLVSIAAGIYATVRLFRKDRS